VAPLTLAIIGAGPFGLAQAAWAADAGIDYAIVGYPGMNPAPPNYPPSADAAMVKIDLAKMGEERARILAEWTKRYDSKSAPK